MIGPTGSGHVRFQGVKRTCVGRPAYWWHSLYPVSQTNTPGRHRFVDEANPNWVRFVDLPALADEAMATGLKCRIADMEDRLGRLQDRAAKRRQIVKDAMIELDLKKR